MILINTNARWATQLKVNDSEIIVQKKQALSNLIAGLEDMKTKNIILSYDNVRVDKEGVVHFCIQPSNTVEKILINFDVAL